MSNTESAGADSGVESANAESPDAESGVESAGAEFGVDRPVGGVPLMAMAEICVIPISGSVSVRAEVARAHQILLDTGLEVELHAYGTNIEGPMPMILAAIERIHTELHADGVPRIHTAIKLGSRVDKTQHLGDKIDAVNALVDRGGDG